MASRKITLSEAVDFCTRSSDEEDIADDDGVFAENNEDVVVDSTMFGNPDDMLSENENEDLTSEEEQSHDDDCDVDDGDKNVYDKRQFHPRKQKRMVLSIHISLDENNYELIDMSKVEKEEAIVVLEKKKKAVTNSMTWTTEQTPQRVQHGPQNIIKNPAGVKPEYREKIEPLDAWSVFVNDDMIQMTVNWTNQSIRQSLSKCKQSASDENVAHLFETNEREMKAFIGLWYIRGLLNWNNKT